MIKEILSFEIIILILAARFSAGKKEPTSLSEEGRDSLCHVRPQHSYPNARIRQADCLRGFMLTFGVSHKLDFMKRTPAIFRKNRR